MKIQALQNETLSLVSTTALALLAATIMIAPSTMAVEKDALNSTDVAFVKKSYSRNG
jgi:hypothetical protein